MSNDSDSDETPAKRYEDPETYKHSLKHSREFSKFRETLLDFRPKKNVYEFSYQSKVITVSSEQAEEIGYLKKTESRVIKLDEIVKTDSNFNRAGINLCFSILGSSEPFDHQNFKKNPGNLVSALAVAHHLEIKTVMVTCGDLMKENVDETVSGMHFYKTISSLPLLLFSLNRTASCSTTPANYTHKH